MHFLTLMHRHGKINYALFTTVLSGRNAPDNCGNAIGERTMWLFLFALWIVLNGRVTLELVIFGVVIASAVTFFALFCSISNYRRVCTAAICSLQLRGILMYIFNLIWEIIVSAFKMCGMVYRADPPDPVIIEFHSGFDTQLQNVLLANSITLTPGTITLFQEGDHFVVHCLRREFGDGIDESSFVKLLRKIK